jgi:hypothetical protein
MSKLLLETELMRNKAVFFEFLRGVFLISLGIVIGGFLFSSEGISYLTVMRAKNWTE